MIVVIIVNSVLAYVTTCHQSDFMTERTPDPVVLTFLLKVNIINPRPSGS